MVNKISTPCIGVCSTIYGDDICRGCHRFFDEIINWNALDEDKKSAINNRIYSLQAKYTEQYIQINDITLLKQAISRYDIRYNQQSSEICWAYKLLKALFTGTEAQNIYKQFKDAKLNTLKQLGLKSLSNQFTNIQQVITKIDEHIYGESEHIHQERPIEL